MIQGEPHHKVNPTKHLRKSRNPNLSNTPNIPSPTNGAIDINPNLSRPHQPQGTLGIHNTINTTSECNPNPIHFHPPQATTSSGDNRAQSSSTTHIQTQHWDLPPPMVPAYHQPPPPAIQQQSPLNMAQTINQPTLLLELPPHLPQQLDREQGLPKEEVQHIGKCSTQYCTNSLITYRGGEETDILGGKLLLSTMNINTFNHYVKTLSIIPL